MYGSAGGDHPSNGFVADDNEVIARWQRAIAANARVHHFGERTDVHDRHIAGETVKGWTRSPVVPVFAVVVVFDHNRTVLTRPVDQLHAAGERHRRARRKLV